ALRRAHLRARARLDARPEGRVLASQRRGRVMTSFEERPLDVICLGRVAVDLYGKQVGGRLEDMQSFNMYLGGSSGNVAFGTARLGLRSSMLSRVGDEHLGRFLRD